MNSSSDAAVYSWQLARNGPAIVPAGNSFAITFNTTANPFVGDGLWINRGLDWTKFATDGVKAYCSNPVAPQHGDIFMADIVETPGVGVTLTSSYKRGAAAPAILSKINLIAVGSANYIAPTAADGVGLAFFTRTGTTATSYGLSSFACNSV